MKTLARICAVASLAWLLGGCQETLLSKLSEQQANEVVAALAEHGLSSSKVIVDDSNWRIQVDEQHLAAAVKVLQSTGLPSARNPTMGELFKKEGLVSSPTEERVRYVYAISQELATTLKRLDGVVDARVHVVIPNNDPLAERIMPSSASVFIKHRPSANLASLSQNIKSLVQSSVEGLDHEHISLFTFQGAAAYTKEVPEPVRKSSGINGGHTQQLVLLCVIALGIFSLVYFLAMRFLAPREANAKPTSGGTWLKNIYGSVLAMGKKS